MTVGKPHAGTRLAAYVTKRILELRPSKSQAQIAAETGFVNANMLAMVKSGATRLPIDRVPALARAIDCDPAYLLLLALEQMVGGTEAVAITSILSNAVTNNEMAWVTAVREASEMSDPPLTRRARAAIFEVFGK